MDFDEMTIEEIKNFIQQAEDHLTERYQEFENVAIGRITQIVKNYCNETGRDGLILSYISNGCKYAVTVSVNPDNSLYFE